MAEAGYVQKFEDLFSTKYKKELDTLSEFFPKQKSLNVDYKILEEFDIELADELMNKPYTIISSAQEAIANMKIINSDEKQVLPYVRFFNLPTDSVIMVRDINSSHINKFIALEGVITKITEVKPKITMAVFQCNHCGRVYKMPQNSPTDGLMEPGVCSCERRSYKSLPEQSEFIDNQKMGVQEPLEKTRGGDQTRKVDIILEDDLTNKLTPGDKVMVTGVLLLQPPKDKKTVYDMIIQANYVEKIEKEFEELDLTEQEEKEIIELSKDPQLYDKIKRSIAPSIYGHMEIKEAIAMQLFGGTPHKVKLEGMKIRPDTHILLIGDPGCLIGDERVVLANGAIEKLQNLGSGHLQDINVKMLTGQGYTKDTATVFHSYKNQPIIEIITETGKSIKGTYNHPLLSVKDRKREWKRLDEIKVGDKLAAIPWIPCTITAPVKTGWKKEKSHFGPKTKSSLPNAVDENLAGIMGYVLGDGWVRDYRFSALVNDSEKDLVPILSEMIEKSFKMKPKVRQNKPKKGRTMVLTEIEINDKDAARCLSMLREKRVPDLILKSGNKAVAEFISWLFEADGCVFSKGRGRRAIQLKSASVELLRDVQILLLRYGIHSRIIERNLQVRRTESINKFAKSIGFKSAKKKQKLEKLVEDCKHLREQNIRGKQLSEKVVSVKKVGYADVFDVEIPKTHRFIANGIISHNTAKSQLLNYVKNLAPKGIYVSGKSSSAAGLTATAEKDDFGNGGWTLKAGALVLAAGGMAMVDEFDKMSEEDRSSMHEAMESQEIHVAKAGMIATFKANSSILAAANPKLGRFDPMEPPGKQFNIPPTIMSRFDLIFAIKDVLDEKMDSALADRVLTTHLTAAMKLKKDYDKVKVAKLEEQVTPAIEPDKLRKYIAYARRSCRPILTDEAMEKIKDFYVQTRKKGEGGSVPITARYLEGIVRLSEASAKARLSDNVDLEDAERAINLLMFSLRQIGLDPETGKIDIDIIATGTSKSKVDRIKTVLKIIRKLDETMGEAKFEAIVEEAKAENVKESEVEEIVQTLNRNGDIFKPRYGTYKITKQQKE